MMLRKLFVKLAGVAFTRKRLTPDVAIDAIRVGDGPWFCAEKINGRFRYLWPDGLTPTGIEGHTLLMARRNMVFNLPNLSQQWEAITRS